MTATDYHIDEQETVSWYRDVRVLKVVVQAVFAVMVVGAGWWLYSNFQTASAQQGLPQGYGYLQRPTNFTIPDNPIRSSQPALDALRVGIQNTVASVAVGLVLSTVLGIIIGVGRLSQNWLVRKVTQAYVETLRNIPPLVIIVILLTPILGNALPQIQEAWEYPNLVVLSNRGIHVPWIRANAEGAGSYWWVVVAGLLAAAAVAWWRTRVNERTGNPHHRVLWGSGVLLAVAAIGYALMDAPFGMTGPVRDVRVIEGGIEMGTPYAAVTFGLAIYTASHIAEIVRGSIQAVHRGQDEAAAALALSSFQRMRYVVLPQAFRIMVPPLSSQYLNFTKNTSLATFIGYAEITRVTETLIGNGNPAVQGILILMAVYLTFSLCISFGANAVNTRLQEGSYPWWTPAVPMLYMGVLWVYFVVLPQAARLGREVAGGESWTLATVVVIVLGGASLVYRFGRERKWFGRTGLATATIRGGAR